MNKRLYIKEIKVTSQKSHINFYLDVENKIPFTNPNVDKATNIEMIQA